MTRDEVFSLIRSHLSEELGIEAARIREDTRFREDLDADSLDLYEVVMELEDTYGVRIPDDEAALIVTIGQAVDYVMAHGAAERAPDPQT